LSDDFPIDYMHYGAALAAALPKTKRKPQTQRACPDCFSGMSSWSRTGEGTWRAKYYCGAILESNPNPKQYRNYIVIEKGAKCVEREWKDFGTSLVVQEIDQNLKKFEYKMQYEMDFLAHTLDIMEHLGWGSVWEFNGPLLDAIDSRLNTTKNICTSMIKMCQHVQSRRHLSEKPDKHLKVVELVRDEPK